MLPSKICLATNQCPGRKITPSNSTKKRGLNVRKLRNLIGMPVICHRRKIGRLVQAELSPDLKRMEGVWVDCGLRGTRYIPAEQLSMIGERAVLSDSRGRRRKCNVHSMLRRAVSTDGARLGAIVGAEVDELSFLVSSLELTRGFWDDLRGGRSRVEHYNAQAGGAEIIVLDSTQAMEKEEDP